MNVQQAPLNVKSHHFKEYEVSASYIGDIGWGLIAETDFAPGECIFWIDPCDTSGLSVLPWHESFGARTNRSITFVPGLALCVSKEHPLCYVNHSCKSNSGFKNWGRLEENGIPMVAYQTIRRGEQITMDYPSFTPAYDGGLDGRPWIMAKCLCRQPGCLRTITDFRHLPLETQLETLLPEGPFQGRVLAHILPDLRVLVATLRNVAPHLYAQYLEVLQQQVALSTILRIAPDPEGADGRDEHRPAAADSW